MDNYESVRYKSFYVVVNLHVWIQLVKRNQENTILTSPEIEKPKTDSQTV